MQGSKQLLQRIYERASSGTKTGTTAGSEPEKGPQALIDGRLSRRQ
jgi:hypothetical protein